MTVVCGGRIQLGEEKVEVLIGTSLSEPHISVTALSTCVYLCLLGPTTYRKLMSAFKFLYFTISDVHADVYFIYVERYCQTAGSV